MISNQSIVQSNFNKKPKQTDDKPDDQSNPQAFDDKFESGQINPLIFIFWHDNPSSHKSVT